ncbi:MAG: hypothetical protein K2G89_02145 [Lachnospiraceae bacterium]|nr:hypothetical protein [Lachnospiraceae bacterium]
MLGIKSEDWEYRVLPNKLLELVKNVGNMEQKGTGLYMESESEMLTILNYLNYGDDTNITESMKNQVMKSIETVEDSQLSERDDADRYRDVTGASDGFHFEGFGGTGSYAAENFGSEEDAGSESGLGNDRFSREGGFGRFDDPEDSGGLGRGGF